MAIIPSRLGAQRLAGRRATSPAALVAALGAIQAQDWAGAKWAVALRMRRAVGEADVERALADGEVLRLHVMRFTWQLVHPDDVRWLTALVRPVLLARTTGRHRELGIDAATLRKSARAIEKALGDGRHRTRDEIATLLAAAGVRATGPRLAHLVGCAELEGLVTSGARRGAQHTYALVEHRAPGARSLERPDAIAELARRYFATRGPATLADFVWWSGLGVREARVGLEAARPSLHAEEVGGRTLFRPSVRSPKARAPAALLLPPFDEYFVAYEDRVDVLDPRAAHRLNSGGGMLNPAVVVDGRFVGTWRRTFVRDTVDVTLDFWRRPTSSEARAIAVAAERYAAFLGRALVLRRARTR